MAKIYHQGTTSVVAITVEDHCGIAIDEAFVVVEMEKKMATLQPQYNRHGCSIRAKYINALICCRLN